MTYRLGVDLGTTYTAAAVRADDAPGGTPEMLALGNRAMQVPSVLFVREDGEVLVGEAAERRGTTEPARVVREFKRRVGDPVPLVVGGTPYSPQALVGKLLRWVVDVATERRGEPPAQITVTYPANWGPFKRDLMTQAIALADLTDVDLCTEPEAAAITYAWRNRVADGQRVAVYDLGGGTFDAAVLERKAGAFALAGAPEGIEHLGGIDFDEAVFRHVMESLGGGADSAMTTDLPAMTALSRLRRDCVEAKEALSADTETVIPVVLPGTNTSVRLTRGEFEDMVRPALAETVAALRRVLRSSGTEPADLAAIVLVGGSSRIPLASQLLSAEFGRPIALDTHPKHDVALGAALRSTQVLAGAAPAKPAAAAAAPVVAPVPRPPAPQAPTPQPPASPPPSPLPPAPPRPTPAAEPFPEPKREPAARPVAMPASPAPPAQPPAQPPTQPPQQPARTVPRSPEDLFADRPAAARYPGDEAPSPRYGKATTYGRGRGRALAAAAAAVAVAAAVTLLVTSPWSDDDDRTATTSSTGASPTASPDDGLPRSAEPLSREVIVYPRQVSAEDWDIATVPFRGGGPETPIRTGPTNDSFPTISDDRRTVVYVRRTSPTTSELRVMGADGSGDRALFTTPPADCGYAARPAWRGGSFVLPCRDLTTNVSTLRVMALDGTVVRKLDESTLGDPSLSPDGTTVYYWRTPVPQDGGELASAPVDGSEKATPLTDGGEQRDNDPAVSPVDGAIAFARAGVQDGLWLLSQDGTEEQLTSQAGDQDPTWSPDGKWIAFKRDNLLWVMRADGSGAKRLTQESTADTAAAWTSR